MSDNWPLGIMRRRAGEPQPQVKVVRPTAIAGVVAALRDAARDGLRMVPMGGRSAVTGAVDVGPADVGLDLTGLDRILDVDLVNLTVRVEAGVNGLVLEEHLNRLGLTLGHFPSSLPVATIGGLISTRSSGQFSTSSGGIEDMVMGLTVCLPDGTVAQARPGPRSAAGPALHDLFVGAEGALGVVLEAILRVSRLPPASFGRGFDFGSVPEGLEAMRSVMQRGIRPFLLRLYDHEDTAFQGSDAAGCLLVAGVSGEPGIATAAMAALAETCFDNGGRDLGEAPYVRWTDRRFHLSRERLLESLQSPGSFLDTIEVAAAWDRLQLLHAAVKPVLAAEGIGLCHFAHAYQQGCCAYFTFAGAAASEEAAQAAYQRCWEGTMAACLEHSATIAHHHGVGQVRAPWVRQEMGEWWGIWQRVRSSLDPGDLMNPNAVGGRWQPPS